MMMMMMMYLVLKPTIVYPYVKAAIIVKCSNERGFWSH